MNSLSQNLLVPRWNPTLKPTSAPSYGKSRPIDSELGQVHTANCHGLMVLDRPVIRSPYEGPFGRELRLILRFGRQFVNKFGELGVAVHLVSDRPAGVQHGCVVPSPKITANLLQTVRGQLAS